MTKKKHFTLSFSMLLTAAMFLGQMLPVQAEENVPPTDEATIELTGNTSPTPDPEDPDEPDLEANGEENFSEEESQEDSSVPDVEDSQQNDEGDSEVNLDPSGADETQDVITQPEVTVPEENNNPENKEPEESTQEYFAAVEDGGIQIKAVAQKGALPENVQLTAKMLESDTEEYQKAAETLDAQNVQYSGFMALDIHFEAEGVEVEPEYGSVNVEMTLNKDLLPSIEGDDTVEIQHHSEDGAEVKAEAVAATQTKTIADAGSDLKAEFSVNSFSTFTVTWKTHYKFHITRVTNQGEILGTNDQDISLNVNNWGLSRSKTFKIEDQFKTSELADEYEYKEAKLDDYGLSGKTVDSFKVYRNGENKVEFLNSNTVVRTLDEGNGKYVDR